MIKTELQDKVCIITLDRIERRNAVGTEMANKLLHALDAANRDDAVGAIVLGGEGGVFCAGSDLKELGGLDPAEMAEHERGTAALVRRFPLLDKPVLAAVEGYAMGGGFILASACDIVVAARSSQWLLAEVPNGWLPPWGLQPLIARVGPVVAQRLTLGHERLDGAAVSALGISDYLSEPGQALADAMTHARLIAALPLAAVRSTKRFFAPFIAGLAESMDATANNAFIDNCMHPAAQATLMKFGGRHV